MAHDTSAATDPGIHERPGRSVPEKHDCPPGERRDGVSECRTGQEADDVAFAEQREPERQAGNDGQRQQCGVSEPADAAQERDRDRDRRDERDGNDG